MSNAINVSATIHTTVDFSNWIGWTGREELGDDTCLYTIHLDFMFSGFGANTSTVSLSSNGVLFFGQDCNSRAGNQALPTDQLSNGAFLAFFWDDMLEQSTAYVKYRTSGVWPGRVFDMVYLNQKSRDTCPYGIIVLISIHERSNLVKVSYLRPETFGVCNWHNGASATFGLQTAGGNTAQAVLLGYNSPILDPRERMQTISYQPPAP